MKLISTLILVLHFTASYSQWTRVQQLPATDIFTLYHKDSILYAGGTNTVYFSKDKGQSWDSTTIIPSFHTVDNIIVYKNELYAACYSIGVFKSPDGGHTWQNITAGMYPFISDFCEFNGNLYAATLGSSVFKLDSLSRSNWIFFSAGLSDLSVNINSIAGNNNALIAGTNANGLYDYLPANSTNWEERFLSGQVDPTEGTYDIITSHDTLFLAGHRGFCYMSTDNGLTWNIFGSRLTSLNTSIVNAKQAILSSRTFVDGATGTLSTSFQYIKKDLLQDPFVPFSTVSDHFNYKLEIFGNRIWDASNVGLFYMSLSDLPGITPADDSIPPTALPVTFIQFNTRCDGNNVVISWKTAQENNSSHFDIERSSDGIHWTTIGTLPAAGVSNSEKSYSFNDNNPAQGSYYRIAEYDLDGKVQYTTALRSSCITSGVFTVSPNPFHDVFLINIVASNESQAAIKVFDNKGSLVKMQNAAVLQGNNQLRVDVGSLASGVYTLLADWNNGESRKVMQILKQ